ncbi:MAG: class I SAM-dependent methyltransferase [bacterium]|nr:class I SAM-dependent methyltransferase [bacterium]
MPSPRIRVLSRPVASEFPSEWYGLATAEHFWMAWRVAAFVRQLRALGVDVGVPLHVLEVGCGNGVLRRQLERATRWTTDGTDLNTTALEQSVATRGETLFYDVHDRLPAFADRWDAIVLFDVLEHVHEPGPFLDSVLFHLKPGGWLFVNVPALEALRSAYDRATGHLRRYDRPTMRATLAPHGLVVRDLRYWGLTLVPVLLARTVWTATRDGTGDVIRSGFEPPAAWMNRALLQLMRCETAVVRRPPMGTSLLAAAQKPAATTASA